jgi:SAM-dependent methyltransferase
MERAIVHSDLKKQEIQPQSLLDKYLALLDIDIQNIFHEGSLEAANCPVTGESHTRESFQKLHMKYLISQSLGNIYISPRPSPKLLKNFYYNSKAREFWINSVWPETRIARREKIIDPQLMWAKTFLTQYFGERKLLMAEFLANHWGYYEGSKDIFPSSEYKLTEILFNPNYLRKIFPNDLIGESDDSHFDAVFLFEALDRAPNPVELITEVHTSLNPGGLCFITCLLSSGFEIQILGQKSEIFVPPERMNLFSYEGMIALIEKVGGFEVLEFSTPGVLDIPNVVSKLEKIDDVPFISYIFNQRKNEELDYSFHEFLQLNRLGTFGRLVLKKK